MPAGLAAVAWVRLIIDPALAGHDTIAWAIERFTVVLRSAGIRATGATDTPHAHTLAVGLAGFDATLGTEGYRLETAPGGVTISAGGAVGFCYALSELADSIVARDFVMGASATITERPAVPVRGIARAFSSVDEDAPWFHDRAFWTEYLDYLAAQRFNRFHLAFGMQFNYGTIDRGLIDNYFAFAYPFLLDVPGYSVRIDGVDRAEQGRNLEALRFIARETRRRGMRFQLGLWTHAYAFFPQTQHRFPVIGMSDAIHADYCAAALSQLLDAVPEIDGLTFRVHFEAGIREANQVEFWSKLFAAIGNAGRPIEVDMHAKGVGPDLLDAASKWSNIDPVLSGKYWAEHLGLPYHQTTIRAKETARPAPPGETMSTLASYSRLFTRYGYADYLSEDRKTDFMFRVWPGTQKLLLWGDPAIAAGYGRYSTIGGSRGVEYCEPLFFKGRKGGSPNRRDPYVRDDLRLGVRDWRKYRYTYLLWGRLLYNPDTEPQVWRRRLREDYGNGAAAAEKGLAALSRILPLVTVVHGVGGANNIYWPELYVDLPISAWVHSDHYDKNYEWDNSAPQNWGRVSPFDPKLFYGIDEYARDALAGRVGARYSPLEVAAWIEGLAQQGEAEIAAIEGADGDPAQVARTVIDLKVLALLGRFFAGKFRAAVDYALFEQGRDPTAIASCLRHYETARAAYASIADVVDGVYQTDLVFGTELSEHGHWSARVHDIDRDIRAIRLESNRAVAPPTGRSPTHRQSRPPLPDGTKHLSQPFQRGKPLHIALTAPEGFLQAVLHYRHLDQSKPFQSLEMAKVGGGFEAEVPATYTHSAFPLIYYFELQPVDGHPQLYPGLDATLSNQPYFVVHSTDWATKAQGN